MILNSWNTAGWVWQKQQVRRHVLAQPCIISIMQWFAKAGPGPAALMSPGNLWEMQIIGPHPKPTVWETDWYGGQKPQPLASREDQCVLQSSGGTGGTRLKLRPPSCCTSFSCWPLSPFPESTFPICYFQKNPHLSVCFSGTWLKTITQN